MRSRPLTPLCVPFGILRKKAPLNSYEFRGWANVITYDTIGNPESYYNGFYFTWADGRRLAYASVGMDSYSFTYNDEGIRTSKTYNNSVTHKYTLDGSRIISEQWGNHFIAYLYDESGAPIGMQYRTSSYAEDVFDTYYFEKNLQGDIVAIYNASGTKLVTYKYDAWGNHTVAYTNGGANTGAYYNPFRYRGYYYDTELGLYYLNSRYYDSNTGRFLNADGYINANGDLIGFNMFAYCSNNPVMLVDHTGCISETIGSYSSSRLFLNSQYSGSDTMSGGGGEVLLFAKTFAKVISDVATIATIVVGVIESEKAKTYSVYFLQDKDGIIRYVGRVTDKGYDARMRYHEITKNYTPYLRVQGLSYEVARGLEEIGMIACHTLNDPSKGSNKIHGISPLNKKGFIYMNAALDYLLNRAENKLLNLLSFE